MTKKRLLIAAGVILVIILIYWFYFSKPSSFPSKEQAIKEITSSFPEVSVKVIQDTIRIDEHHMLVPFISKEKDYGLSYWVWQNHNWEVQGLDTKGSPSIWKLNDDPSSFQLVWNIHPDNKLKSIDFYLMRDRNFAISGGIGEYYPKVQMKKNVSLMKKTYGAVNLPREWSALINTFSKSESNKQPSLLSNHFFLDQSISFSWLPISQSGKDTLNLDTINGTGYSNSIANVEELIVSNKDELELP